MELVRVANYKELQEWEEYITLLIDEIHLKEDLVYDKVTGAKGGETNQSTYLFSPPLVTQMSTC